MSTTPVIRYRPVEAPSRTWLKFYEIHMDGKVVGYVGTQEVRFERPLSKGSRIVGRRTLAPRWFVQSPVESTPQSRAWRTSKIWYETRKQAVERLLRDQNDTLPQHEQVDRRLFDKAVEESRDFKKSELPA